MDVQTQKPYAPQFKNVTVTPQMFIANEPARVGNMALTLWSYKL